LIQANFVDLAGRLTQAESDIDDLEDDVADIVSGETKLAKVSLDTVNPSATLNAGETRWNDDEKTSETKLSDNVTVQNGQELFIRARNGETSTITNGTVVYIYGELGNSGKALIKRASNTTHAEATSIIGVATEAIAQNQEGFITVIGRVRHLNLSSYAIGTKLYLGTNGALTSTAPTKGVGTRVSIGVVESDSATEGILLVSPRILYNLNDLSNVQITSVANNNVIVWNAANNRWQNMSYVDFCAILLLTNNTWAGTNTFNGATTFNQPVAINGVLSMEGEKIINLATGTNPTDGVNVGQMNTQLALKENKSEKGAISGYAPLDANQKLPLLYLYDSVLGQVEYAGVFDASTGSYPTQTNALSPNRDIRKGDFFITSVDGTVGGVEYKVGDWAVRGASSWAKIDNTDAVASVNGKLGVVVLDGTDIKVGSGDTTTLQAKIVSIDEALSNRYTKTQTYSKEEIEALVNSIIAIQGLDVTVLTPLTSGQSADLSQYDLVIAHCLNPSEDGQVATQAFTPAQISLDEQVQFHVEFSSANVFVGYLVKGTTQWDYIEVDGNDTVLRLTGIKFLDLEASNIDTAFTGTNYLDAEENVEDSLIKLDEVIGNIEDGTTELPYDETRSLNEAIADVVSGTTKILYDNTVSGLQATNIPFAIDEVASLIETGDTNAEVILARGTFDTLRERLNNTDDSFLQRLNLISNEDEKKYKLVAGVIRNTVDGWRLIEDTVHTNMNIDSVSSDTSKITINFSFTAKKIISFIVAVDEDYAKKSYQTGASVGTNVAYIEVQQLPKTIGGYIRYNAGAWQYLGNNSVTITSYTNGVLTLSHENLGTDYSANVSGRDGVFSPQLSSIGGTTTTIKFYNWDGTLATTPTTDMKCYFTTSIASKTLNPSAMSTEGNLWLFGIFEVE